MNENAVVKSIRTLTETSKKALVFLQTLAAVHAIRMLMRAAGYTDEEDAMGWTLVRRLFGHGPPSEESATPDAVDAPAHEAVRQVVEWAKSAFVRIHAALTRLHPAQATFLFEGIAPTNDSETVQAVLTVLDRIDEMDSGTTRKPTHKADQAALKTMASRSYTLEERKRVRALVETAQGGAITAVQQPVTDKAADKKAEQVHADLVALDAWYTDWSTTAREVITRRDYRIRLGIAKRRKSEAQKAKEAKLAEERKAQKAAQPKAPPKIPVETAALDEQKSPADTTATDSSSAKTTPANGQNGRAAPRKSPSQKTP